MPIPGVRRRQGGGSQTVDAKPGDTLTRRKLMRRGLAFAAGLGGVMVVSAGSRAQASPQQRRNTPLRLQRLRVHGGGVRFKRDNPMLATISPTRNQKARTVTISFVLDRKIRLRLEVARGGRRGPERVATENFKLNAGRHRIAWTAPRELAPGTYLLRLRATDRRGRTIFYGRHPLDKQRRPAPVLRVLGVHIALARRSYQAGQRAVLRVEADTAKLVLRVFHSSSEETATRRNDEMRGTPVGEPIVRAWRRYRHRDHAIRLRVGDWPSGLYFVRATSTDGRHGFAPFVVRPTEPGEHRVAVVLPTHTWQAYNFFDQNCDGWGDTWYARTTDRIELDRPYLNNGVPPRFRVYDLPFLRWLRMGGKQADFYAEDDLERFASGAALRDAYDVIVFPGHSEYMTEHAYDVIEGFRDLGGNLMFLSANSFFWKVQKRGSYLDRIALWRESGRPEAALIGTQYLANDDGSCRDAFVVTGADLAPWVFKGTGLTNGNVFGQYGIEIDHTTEASPKGTIVLARIPDLFGPGQTAEMTYHETVSGARIFSAGVLAFGTRAMHDKVVSQILENVWRKLTQS